MQKKIAILVRDRQSEALRMSAGMILADDAVSVFVLDRKVEATPENAANIELLKDMDQHVYTNTPENPELELLSNAAIAELLAQHDNIIPY
ncbi:MAG TPA: hypothetical protein VI078_03560 [bacterium]